MTLSPPSSFSHASSSSSSSSSSSVSSLYDMYLTVFVLFSVLIILSNLLFMGCVLGSPRLRTAVPHQLMTSIAGMDLLLGCFILPLLIRSLVESQAPICHVHSALQAMGDYGLFFICGWSFVTLDLYFLVGNLFPHWVCTKPRVPKCVKNNALCLWPWIASTIILIPIVFLDPPYEPVHRLHWRDPMCLSNFPRKAQMALDTICLYLPIILCAIVVAILIVIFIRNELNLLSLSASASSEMDEPALMEDSSNNGGTVVTTTTTTTTTTRRNYTDEATTFSTQATAVNHPLSICLPNLIYFLCYIPVALSSFMTLDFKFGAGRSSTAQASLIVLVPMLTRSVALPVAWLSMATVRQEVGASVSYFWNCLSRLCCRMAGIPSANVSYTGLREVQTL